MVKYNNLTLTDIFRRLKSEKKKGIYFLHNYEDFFLSYRDLCFESLCAMTHLQKRGLKPDEKVILMISEPIDFVKLFWGAILGGFIPVPVASQINPEINQKLFRICDILDSNYLVTDSSSLKKIHRYALEINQQTFLDQINDRIILLSNMAEPVEQYGEINDTTPDKIAFLQFSSGTTGYPKGVIVTHKNIITNVNAIINCSNVTDQDSYLSWMPLSHDMGLIGFHIMPLIKNINQYNMSPNLFLRKPNLWLEKISDYKVTNTGSPNFGYNYLLKYRKDLKDKKIDLSSLKRIYNGAEPISIDLCDQFLTTFSQYGLKREAMFPVYGLAEATLAVSFPPLDEQPFAYYLNRNRLTIGEKIEYSKKDKPNASAFVDVGYAVDNCQIRIAADDDTILTEEIVGHIQISGAVVTQGYYNDPEKTKQSFTKDGWLRTGDIGFVKNNRLVITGRSKDILFVNGQNYYAHDIERILTSLGEIELNDVVALGTFDKQMQTEQIVICIKYKENKIEQFSELVGRVKQYLFEQFTIDTKHVIPVKKIFKTTSGKLQRNLLLKDYEQGKYDDIIKKVAMLLKKNQILSINQQMPKHIEKYSTILENDLKKMLVHELMIEENELTKIKNLYSLGLKAQNIVNITYYLNKKFGLKIPCHYNLDFTMIVTIINGLRCSYSEIILKYYESIKEFIIDKMSTIFNIEKSQISENTDLTYLGFTSILGIQFANIIKEKYGKFIDQETVFTQRTCNKLLNSISEQITCNIINEKKYQRSNTKKDSTVNLKSPFQTENIFLTGVTGILGGYLLKELLETANHTVYCLMRAEDKNQAYQRIGQILTVYAPDKDFVNQIRPRIIPVCGDITKPNLGLQPEIYSYLATNIDLVIHAAAMTGLHGIYEQVKLVNVNGTSNVVSFAKKTKQKYFVFISSCSIMGDRAYKQCAPLRESDFDLKQDFKNLGYPQSKFVSEKEIRSYGSNELQWIIIRPGNIMGDSKKGYYPFTISGSKGLFYDIFKTDIEKGYAMNNPSFFDISPVDFVSKAIVYLTTQRIKIGKTYHLVNNEHKRFYEIIYLIKRFGYKIDLLSTSDYMDRLYNHKFTEDGKEYSSLSLDLFKFNPIILDRQLTNTESNYAENYFTRSILEAAGIYCPSIDFALIKTYLEYCIDVGYIKKVPEQKLTLNWQ